jgi:hypothetical protein
LQFGNSERWLGGVGEIDIDVVGDKEVEQAVAVVVDEGAAGAEANAFVQQACFAVTSVKVPSPLLR